MSRSSASFFRAAWLAAAGLMALPAASYAEDFGSGIAKAFQDGKFNVAFRYRYENADDDNPTLTDDTADASTLRSRITYQTAAWNDFSVLMELDDLRNIGSESYNSSRNGKTYRPLIPDPEATDLNQAYIKYTGFTNTEVILGRQKIIRGNERFVGPVGWRQNEQSFDALSVNYKFNDKLQAYYAFVDVVNRVFGPDEVPSGTWPNGTAVTAAQRSNWADEYEGDTHLFDATYTFSPAAKLTGYGYFIEFNENQALSSQTLGLRLAGDVALNDRIAIPYAIEYASQEDYGSSQLDYDADYYLVDVGIRYQKVTTRLAYEVLEGNRDANSMKVQSFQTPLATGHAFQGWADKFLTTPSDGIEDMYLLIDFPLFGANVKIRYDLYEAETGSYDYGDELGIWATLPIGKNYSVALKYAAFDADSDVNALPAAVANGLRDTDKFWVILSANF